MRATEPIGSSLLANAPPDRNAVLRQMEHLLEHIAFRKSVRCTKLLRYLVEQSLSDPDFHPKERTLAIEVFDRSPDYDTAADPIVRTTANEIRKRLGSYFHDTGPAAEVYIELPSGGYRPVFRAATARAVVEDTPSLGKERPRGVSPSIASRPYVLAACVAGVVVILLASALVLRPQLSQSNADRFWRPFLFSSRRILVCTPAADSATKTPDNTVVAAVSAGLQPTSPQTPMISMSDSKAVWRVLSVLDTRKEAVVLVRTSDRVQADDLRDGPAIIIGALDNPWSAVLISRLRFQIIADDSNQTARIVDRQSPSDRRWSVDTRDLSRDNGRSYALISRVIDPATRNPVMSIAGVGMYATAAAGEFIAQPGYLNAMGKSLSDCGNNLQLVLSAEAANGVVNRRKVEAVHCW